MLKAELVDSVWPNAETGRADSVVEAKFVLLRLESVVNSPAKVDVCVPSESVSSTEKFPVVWILELDSVEKAEVDELSEVVIGSCVFTLLGDVINSFSFFVVSGFKVELTGVESELPEVVEIELLVDSSVEGDAVVVICDIIPINEVKVLVRKESEVDSSESVITGGDDVVINSFSFVVSGELIPIVEELKEVLDSV